MALLCSALAALPRSPENQTLLPCQSLLVFVWKIKNRFLFVHFFSRALTTRAGPHESKRRLYLTYRAGCFLREQQQTGVTMLCTVMRPPVGGEYLLLLVIYWGSYRSRLKCWHFQRLFRKCTKEFHSTLAKSIFTTCL